MDQQSLHCKFLGCLQNETGAMRDVGSAWVLNFGSVWTTSTSVFPSRRVKTPCFAEHLQLRSINSIYFNEITAYHLASHHVISYLPSFYMPGLPGWLNWLACVTTSDAGRCFYLSHRSWNWDDQLRLWLADVGFLRQEPEWNTSFFYPTIWRVRRWWRSRSDWTGKSWNLPKLGIGKRSHSFSAQSLRRPWTTWHVVDWRGHASMLCLLWRPRFLTFFMTLLLGSYGVAQERDAHEVRSWALEDERDHHRYRCV